MHTSWLFASLRAPPPSKNSSCSRRWRPERQRRSCDWVGSTWTPASISGGPASLSRASRPSTVRSSAFQRIDATTDTGGSDFRRGHPSWPWSWWWAPRSLRHGFAVDSGKTPSIDDQAAPTAGYIASPSTANRSSERLTLAQIDRSGFSRRKSGAVQRHARSTSRSSISRTTDGSDSRTNLTPCPARSAEPWP